MLSSREKQALLLPANVHRPLNSKPKTLIFHLSSPSLGSQAAQPADVQSEEKKPTQARKSHTDNRSSWTLDAEAHFFLRKRTPLPPWAIVPLPLLLLIEHEGLASSELMLAMAKESVLCA